MRGYWTYYLGWIALMYLLRSPWLLLGVVAFLVFRRFIPDPGVLFGTWGRIRSLRGQIEANAANVSARRDLARIYIDRKRPGRAISLLDEALERHPDDAELLFLKGLAEHRRGNHEAALDPLVRAVEVDARVGFGEPYLVAGDALFALGRLPEAEDAYARFVDANGSSIEGQLKLARTLARAGKRDEASKGVDEALDTHAQLPGYARRKQFGWWLRCQLAKATIQRRPGAVFVVLCALGIGCFLGLLVVRGVRTDLSSRNGILPRTFGIRRFLPPPPSKTRFARVAPSRAEGAQHARFRSRPDTEAAFDPALADFACRIWGLYGAPDPGAEGDFAFTFEDTSSGVVFVATSKIGFPSYAVTPATRAKSPATFESFDALLDVTRPIDCSVQVATESGPMRYAVQGGHPTLLIVD
jgi:tetratricopeptide (TPR) repeat protein